MTHKRKQLVKSWLGFNHGTLPMQYLGIPIFIGRPKLAYFQAIVDKVKLKFALWKGTMLSFMGRVQLAKSVISSMLFYSFSVYMWPQSLLKMLESWINNFIWTGSIDKRKLVTVNWGQVCKPQKEGGLGLTTLATLNKTNIVKLYWRILYSDEQWAYFLRGQFFKNRQPLFIYRKSSIWLGLRQFLNLVPIRSR